ncbi:MAG: nucleotidyltransferase domain-containing protein [Candidatus Hadarchaeota archaeon]|nr:nucleotidyltransferase domain-containing protein [Candidatus Hadarchaeota archaeon]
MYAGARLKELFDIGEKIGKLPGVLAVTLFGSAARGEATIESDIDIAVIYDKKNEGVMKRVEKLAPPRVHIVHVAQKELKKNVSLAGALSGEGLLLFGKPVVLQAKKLKLKPMLIIAYDTRELNGNARNKLSHALYGRTSTTKRGKQRYVRKYEGITARPGIWKIGKAVLLVSRERASAITRTLETHGAKWKEIPAWTY